MDFISKTVFGHLLPTRKDFVRHPFESTSRFIEVYKMHMAQTSQQYQQQRLQKAEEVEKRKQFRLERKREAEERGDIEMVMLLSMEPADLLSAEDLDRTREGRARSDSVISL